MIGSMMAPAGVLVRPVSETHMPVRLAVEVPEDFRHALKSLSVETGKTMGEIVVEALAAPSDTLVKAFAECLKRTRAQVAAKKKKSE
jgi:hypothetical protein